MSLFFYVSIDVLGVSLSGCACGETVPDCAGPVHGCGVGGTEGSLPMAVFGEWTGTAGVLGVGKLMSAVSSSWSHDAEKGVAWADGYDACVAI